VTERIYYTEPYTNEFDATVLQLTSTDDGRPAAVLDRTAFYPTSGGQPYDIGRLGSRAVVDVIDQEDGTVLHVLDAAVEAGPIHGTIDWPRRFDHMQQHTGQHVLSAAFDHLFGVRTVSFHLGTTSSSIDLAREVTADEIARAESEANRIVWEDRPVTVRFEDAEAAAAMALRKESKRQGRLRLIDVEGFDLSACGGTHVARTGGIGIIAIAGSERFKGGSRIAFLCGVRALAGYRELRSSVDESVRQLSVLPSELPAAIARIQADVRDARKRAKDMQSDLVAFKADGLAAGATSVGGVALVASSLDGWDQNGLKQIASEIVARPGHVAVLTTTTEPVSIVVARANGVAQDSGAILRQLVEQFGGKGGGRPELAQGGGLRGPAAAILEFVRTRVFSEAAGA
jgi:alanyl-tRNA synthetase